MSRDTILEAVRRKFELLRPLLNERLRRPWAACEAMTLQRGGVTLLAQATGLSRTTLGAGRRELRHPAGGSGPHFGERFGNAGRSDHPRRPPIPAALDL